MPIENSKALKTQPDTLFLVSQEKKRLGYSSQHG